MDPSQSPPLIDQRHEGDVVPLVPKEQPTAEETRSGGPARYPSAGRDSSARCIGMAREGSDFSAELRAVEPSIHVSPLPSGFTNDQFASDRPAIGRRIFRSLVRFFIAALIGVGATLAWQSHGDEAKEIVRTWAPSLGWLLSVSTTKSSPNVDVAAEQTGYIPAGQVSTQDAALPQPAPVTPTVPASAAAAISPKLVQQLEAIARDLAGVRHSVDQLAAKQEQMAHNIVTLQAIEQDIRQKISSPPLFRTVPMPPRKKPPSVAPPLPAALSSSVPRPAPLPRPPMPLR
jgi:hypothetical protein